MAPDDPQDEYTAQVTLGTPATVSTYQITTSPQPTLTGTSTTGLGTGVVGIGGLYTQDDQGGWLYSQSNQGGKLYSQSNQGGNPTLRSILGADISKFSILPTGMSVGFGADNKNMLELVHACRWAKYIEFDGEIAIRRELRDAIIAYAAGDSPYAGLTVVQFLTLTLHPATDTSETTCEPSQL